MPFLFPISTLRGYHAIIEGGIRRGIGADTIFRELDRIGANVPRSLVRGFAREIREQIVGEVNVRQLWARRDIDRTLYSPVAESSRFNYYYNFSANYIDPRTGRQKTTSLSLGTFDELDATGVEERFGELLNRYKTDLPVGTGDFTLSSAQRRVGI